MRDKNTFVDIVINIDFTFFDFITFFVYKLIKFYLSNNSLFKMKIN